MTNQPDAYTLAAQAVADRARAEAVQAKAELAGPGLQNPMRRLSKNPATRWLLSAVLLAAGTALAVDYLNTPLRAWLQYHAPVPGAGGKSIAQIAAEQSAAPAAKIDAEIVQPAIAKAKSDAMEQAVHDEERRTWHNGTYLTLRQPLPFYAVEGENHEVPEYRVEKEALLALDPNVFTRPPQNLAPGENVTPVFTADLTLAVVDGFAVVSDGTQWGLVPLQAYNAAGLPAQDSQQ